jgi:cytoskeleton protein RodZ
MFKRLQNSGRSESTTDVPAKEPVRQTAGGFLRTRREEFGYDLRDVAEHLRIRHVYLVAIEEDRLDDLPGATYAVGFVRAYAEYLRLDGPAIVERFKEETAELAKGARLVFPSPQPEGKVPSGTILLLSVVIAGIVYGGWVLLSSQGRPLAELVPALPDRFMALIGQSDTQPTPQEGETAPESAPPVSAVRAAAPAPEVQKPDMPPVTPAPLKPVTAETIAPPAGSEPPKPAESAPAPAQVATTAVDRPAASAPAEAARPAVSSLENSAASEPIEQGAPGSAEADAVIPPSDGEPASPSAPETAEAPPAPPATSAASSVRSATLIPAKVNVAAMTDGSPLPPAASATEAPASSPQVSAVPGPPPPPQMESAGPREYGAENADARIVLRASDVVWVQVRDKSGNLLLTRLLRVGDSYRVPNDPGLIMRTGNAGGLDILVDGTPIPRIGSKGTVLKEVALDADMLKAGTASRQQ